MGTRPLLNFMKSKETETSEEKVQENIEKQEEEQQNSPDDAVKAFKQEYAGKLGWTPKEEWETAGRDPNLWRDYDDFLDNSPVYFDRLRKKARDQENRMKRNAQAAADAIEETARRTREEAMREAREAATAGDPEAAAAAVAKAASGPPAETVAWIGRNPWFNEDPGARALAAAEVEKGASKGLSISEQLKAAEESVKRRFPEYFEEDNDSDLPDFITKGRKENTEEARREVRMSDSAKVTAAAQSGSSASARNRDTRQVKEKSFKDIPAADQASYQKYFARRFQSRMTPVEAEAKYAKSYWANKE